LKRGIQYGSIWPTSKKADIKRFPCFVFSVEIWEQVHILAPVGYLNAGTETINADHMRGLILQVLH
jgi:hypothetical protein